MYLKCLIICLYLILNSCAMQLIHSLDNQNSIRSIPDFRNTVGLKPDYGGIKIYEPVNSFSENIDFNAPQIRMTQDRWPKIRQPRSAHHNNAKRKTSIRKHGQNLAALSMAVSKLVKKFNKKDNSTNVTETSENLLSPEDSKGNVPITDLINNYTPEDNQHSDANAQGNSKISNKLYTTHHHHHILTKTNYTMNPDIMVVMAALAVILLAAAVAFIVIHTRVHLIIHRIC